MQAANGGKEAMEGCAGFLELEIDVLKTWAHAYVVPQAPYQILLGQPWQQSVMLEKRENGEGVQVVIHDPLDRQNKRVVVTRE